MLKNKFTLTTQSRSFNESFVRATVAAFVLQLDPTIEEISDIKTAVSEAVTNCIVHAYKEKLGNIYISAEIYDNNILKIKIRDKGCGIENISKAMEPLFTTKPEKDRAGMGFAFMEAFMDTVEVVSSPGQGCAVYMKKKIGSGTIPFL